MILDLLVKVDVTSNKILKLCMYTISKPLTYICNGSLNTGTFPERFKLAIMRPIHKKGDKNEINNYRPLSLLTTISKILEIIMYKRLAQHFESNKFLTSAQFGFRKGFRIDDAVFSILNGTIILLDKQKHVGGIFCDLTRAFECVNHNILLHKLQYYGITGSSLSWFKSYLENKAEGLPITKCTRASSVLQVESSS